MKYIKLFENWLNEAEVKPFDANNPDETLVVDITEEDLYKDPKVMHIILQSMFNRGAAKKDSPDVPEAIEVIPLYVGWAKQVNPKEPWHLTSEGNLKGFYVRGVNGEEYTVVNKLNGDDLGKTIETLEALHKEKTPIFLVTNAKDSWFEKKEDGNLFINLKPNNILLLPNWNSGKWEIKNPKGFALDSKIEYRGQERKGGFFNQQLGGLVESMSNFGKSGWASSVSHPTELAKTLGYEIGKDYTPKMGGVKKLGK